MALFDYRGRDASGQAVEGQLEAQSLEQAASALLARAINPIQIKPATPTSSLSVDFKRFTTRQGVEPVEMIMLCRQLHTITKAGIPLVRGLKGLSASVKNPMLKDVLSSVVERLEAGSELSGALRAHPAVFDTLFVNLVAVGESSGKLDAIFKQLAEYLERDLTTIKSIKTALRYPTFVLIAIAIAIALVNIKVIPAFAGMFSQFGAELPLPTRILLAVSDGFVNYWYWILAAVSVLVSGAMYYIKTPEGAIWWGEKKLRLVIIGDIIERASLARYARSFSLMLDAGLPINQALELSARAIDNPYLSQKIRTMRMGVERGESLYSVHSSSTMFTPLVLQMVAIGDESGRVDSLLAEVASFYESEVDYDVKKLSDRIEPIMIVIMAAFVGVLALGIFLPMWDMYNVQQ